MYVDECGDPGGWDPARSPDVQGTSFFILTGLIVPADRWRDYLSALVDIRRFVKLKYGYPVRAELRGSEIIHPRGNPALKQIPRKIRVSLYRDVLEMVSSRLSYARILNVYVDKKKPRYVSTSSADLEVRAWQFLIQRYENFMAHQEERAIGLIFADETNEVKIRKLLRRMRVYNPIPSNFRGYYLRPIDCIVEDPVMRQSHHSYFIQIADLDAHALYRREHRKGSLRSFNVDRLFELLRPLLHLPASRSDPDGIVRL